MATSAKSKIQPNRTRPPDAGLRLNVRLVLIVLTLCVGSAVAVHFVHRFQVQRNADALLARADEARQKGQVDVAIHNYSQYLALRPDDTDALAEVGILLQEDAVAARTVLQAYLTFEAVVRRDASRDDIRRRLVDVCMRLRRFPDALLHIEALKSRDPDNHELVFLAGRCREGQGQWRDAAILYREAIDKAPEEIDHYRRLVQVVLEHSGELVLADLDPVFRESPTANEVADQWMEQAVELGQPRFRAFLARAQYHSQQGQFDEAQADLDQALDLAGDEPDVLLEAAQLNLRRAELSAASGSLADAERQLDAAAGFSERGLAKDPRFFIRLCEVELARNQTEKAMSVLRRGLEEISEAAADAGEKVKTEEALKRAFVERQLVFLLADLLITEAQSSGKTSDDKALAEAEELMQRLKRSGLAESMTKFLQARIEASREQWYNAARLFESARTPGLLADLSQRIGLELSHCYQQLGNPDARLHALRRSIVADRLWIRGRLEFATALVAAERLDDAIDEYRSLIKIRIVPVTLARLLTLQQLTLPPDRRDWTEVEQFLNVSYQALPDSPDVPILEAEVRTQQGQFGQARQILESALANFPKSSAVWAALVLVDLKREDVEPAKRLETARQTLTQAQQKIGHPVELRLAEAELAVHGDREQALGTLDRLRKEAENLDREQRRQMLVGLAHFYEVIGAANELRSVWGQLSKEHPHNLDVWIRLARLAAERDDEAAWTHAVEEIRRIEGPDGPNANYEQAVHLIEQARADDADAEALNRLRESRLLLNQAAKERPTWAAVPRARGVLEELAGNPDESVAQFRRAIELGDRSRAIVQKVAWYFYQRKQFDEANQQLENLASHQPDAVTGDLARLAWRVAWGRQQFDRALGLASAVAEGSEDYRDQIILAEARFARGLRGRDVEDPLNKACQMAPKQPEPWLAKVGYLTRVGRNEDAHSTIDEAETKLSPDIVALTIAQCYELVNDLENAESHYAKFIEAKPDDYRRMITIADFYTRLGDATKAEPYLERLTDSQTGAPEGAVAWARRRRAMVLAGRGSHDDTAAALAMLERNLETGSEHSLADLRAKATILAARPIRRDWLAAIALFEDVGQQSALTPEEDFLLAQLYESTGDWIRAREILLRLMLDNPSHATRLAYWVRALVRHKELDEAQVWMEQLKQRHPDTFLTVTTQATVLGALDRSEDAVPLLRNYLDARRGATESLTDLLEQQKAEEIVQVLDSYLRDRLDADAFRVFVQVRELLGQDQRDRAVQMLEKYVRDRKLDAASQASAMHVAAGLLEDLGELTVAEELFHQFSQQSNHPAAIFILAKFYARNGRIDEALDICERAPQTTEPGLVASASASVIGHSSATAEHFQRAEKLISAALQQTRDSSASLVALADLRLAQRRFVEAERLYRQVLSGNNKHVIALNNLAWCLATQGRQGSEALELIDRAMEVAGRLAALLDTRAIVLLSIGKPQQALEDLHEAFADSDSAIGQLHLADAHLQVGEAELAAELFEAAQARLRVESLHPLERERFERVRAALESRRTASIPLH